MKHTLIYYEQLEENMIYIFTRYKANVTTQKAIRWFEKYGITYRLIYTRDICEDHIKHLLQLSNGTNDILLSYKQGRQT